MKNLNTGCFALNVTQFLLCRAERLHQSVSYLIVVQQVCVLFHLLLMLLVHLTRVISRNQPKWVAVHRQDDATLCQ